MFRELTVTYAVNTSGAVWRGEMLSLFFFSCSVVLRCYKGVFLHLLCVFTVDGANPSPNPNPNP